MITFSINHCCIVGQKEFSIKAEENKIKSFSWNEFSSDNSCFESKQSLLYCPSVFAFGGGGGGGGGGGVSLKKTEYKSLSYCKTKGIFQES